LKKLDYLDEIVIGAGGRIYPAKDSRMKPETFRASFPMINDFLRFKDNKFNSSFWKRVMNC
jgi:L-gulonolactone oxidase